MVFLSVYVVPVCIFVVFLCVPQMVRRRFLHPVEEFLQMKAEGETLCVSFRQ